MEYVQFILKSNSNKKLDALTKELIYAIKCTGGVKAGPIPFKGKRLIYCYTLSSITIDRILAIKQVKDVNITIKLLEKP